MKILILGNTENQPTEKERAYYKKYVNFFKSSAETINDDTIVEVSLFDDLIISVGDGDFSIYNTKNQRDLSEYKALFLRGDQFRKFFGVIGSINKYAIHKGLKVINDYTGVRDSSKLFQAVNFHLLNIPVAKTIYVTSAVIANPSCVDFGFPCVMKADHGSHGDLNYVVNSIDDIKAIFDKYESKRFVLQRFVPNDCDYRILVIGDETLVIRRTAVGDSHLNNTSKGGEAELVDTEDLPKSVFDDTKRIMESLGMTIAGIDVFSDKNTNEFYFLEVNAQPQLMSGAFIKEKEKLMGKLLDKLSDKN
jgi:glutathione synthase/RimK-type ligase-like ATP-grasp enzyme